MIYNANNCPVDLATLPKVLSVICQTGVCSSLQRTISMCHSATAQRLLKLRYTLGERRK